jgi:hypothetical protein
MSRCCQCASRIDAAATAVARTAAPTRYGHRATTLASSSDLIPNFDPRPAATSAGRTPPPCDARRRPNVVTNPSAGVARPPTEKGQRRAKQKAEQRARAKAAEAKRMRQPVQLSAPFLFYSQPDTFDETRFSPGHAVVHSNEDMRRFDSAIEKQRVFNFSERRASVKKQAAAGRSSRSAVLDLDHNQDSHGVSTPDLRDLSRYLMEDMLCSLDGTRFVVCVVKTADADFCGVPACIAAEQRRSESGGDLIRISVKVYLALTGTLTLVNSNEAVRLGMTRGQFEKEYFSDAGGFGFSFDSSRETVTFSWQDTVTRSTDLMFFGRKFEGGRPYDKIFRFKSNPEYAHHVFRQLSNKLRGDSTAVSQLYGAYQKRLRMTYQKKYLEAQAEIAGVYNKQSFKEPLAKSFRKHFDKLCLHAFIHSMSTFQDYTQPIISNVDMMMHMSVAKRVFNTHWRFLASLRGLDVDNDDPFVTAFKERQIFSQLMMLQRVANYKDLIHWALINTTSLYVNGVRAIVVETSRFDGMTVSTTFRDRQFLYLAKGIEKRQRETLRTHMVANFTYNNVTASKRRRGRGLGLTHKWK